MSLESKLKGHFLNLYHLALSDAEVDTTELTMLYKIGEERGVLRSEIDDILIRPDRIKFSPPETVFEKIESLYDFARIILADGKIDENEERVMSMFCIKFGFKEENVAVIVRFLIEEAQKETSKEEIIKIVSDNL